MKTVLARHPDLLEQLGEQLARPAHERQRLLVLVHAGRLAHEHEVGVRVPRPEHDVGAGLRERAARARLSLPVELDELRAALLCAAWVHGGRA